jgi:hypothetical protein
VRKREMNSNVYYKGIKHYKLHENTTLCRRVIQIKQGMASIYLMKEKVISVQALYVMIYFQFERKNKKNGNHARRPTFKHNNTVVLYC